MATGKKGSIINIALWSIALILGLSAGIIGIILLANDTNFVFSLLLSSAGIFIFVFSLKKIIAGNNAWKEAAKLEVLSEKDDVLAVWRYTAKEWEQFVESELKAKRKSAITITASTTAFVFIGVVIGAFLEENLDEDFWKIGIPIVAGTAIIIWFFSTMNISTLRKVYLAHQKRNQPPAVIIGKKGVVISDQLLIAFKPFGGSLVAVKQINKGGRLQLRFGIRTHNGENSAYHEYPVLIPNNHQEEAQEVSKTIRTVYELSS